MTRMILVEIPDDAAQGFDEVVAALNHFEIPAFVSQRDESQTLIERAAQPGATASEIDAAFRAILANGRETTSGLRFMRPSRKHNGG
jgi:Xaa-Pro aminopeptidase